RSEGAALVILDGDELGCLVPVNLRSSFRATFFLPQLVRALPNAFLQITHFPRTSYASSPPPTGKSSASRRTASAVGRAHHRSHRRFPARPCRSSRRPRD